MITLVLQFICGIYLYSLALHHCPDCVQASSYGIHKVGNMQCTATLYKTAPHCTSLQYLERHCTRQHQTAPLCIIILKDQFGHQCFRPSQLMLVDKI